jgi:hypothetical protein
VERRSIERLEDLENSRTAVGRATRAAVVLVSYDRKSCFGEVDADLVCAAGLDADRKERRLRKNFQAGGLGDGWLGASRATRELLAVVDVASERFLDSKSGRWSSVDEG